LTESDQILVKKGGTNQRENRKILIVDDQGFNINALTIILKYVVGLDTDLYIESVLSGQDALQKISDDIDQ
jgi:CheY-like chemotaxis protein